MNQPVTSHSASLRQRHAQAFERHNDMGCFKTVSNGACHCLELVLRDGSRDAPEYVHLLHKKYMPSVGIILFYSHCTVTLYGQHLEMLFDRLHQRKVSQIYTVDKSFAPESPVANDDTMKAVVTDIGIAYANQIMEKQSQELTERGGRP